MLVRAWVSVFFLFLIPVPLVLSCIHAFPAQPWLRSGLPLRSPLPTPIPSQVLFSHCLLLVLVPPEPIAWGSWSLQPHSMTLYPFQH